MRTQFAIAGGNAKAGAASNCGKSRNYLRTNYLVMQKARSLFPYKTAQHLSEITGYPTRTVEYWVSKDRLPGEAIGALIQSDLGLEFVEAIAERTSWFRKIRKALSLSDEKINTVREAQHAATELAAAIARATAATGLRSEELDRREVDERRAIAGLSDRAVAATRRRR
jgi:hypothetical protein